MSDKILIEYQVEVDGLKASMKDVQKSMKETEKVGVDSAKKTEEAFKKTEGATKSLKTQLKELKAQLAIATDPKEIERLAKAAGNLSDKIGDASDAAKVFASESKFEQVGNAIGSIGSKLRNLDFKGAADQSKLLVSVIGSLSFKDVLAGAKDLGTTFLNLGKSLLGNPVFLVGAALVTVGVAIYDLGKSYFALHEQTEAVTKSLNDQKKALSDYADKFQETLIKIKESVGVYSKVQADIKRLEIKSNNDIIAIKKQHAEDIKQLAKDIDIKNSMDVARLLENKIKLENSTNKLILAAQKDFQIQKLALQTQNNIDEGKKSTELRAKLIADAKVANEKQLKEDKDFNDKLLAQAKELRDLLAQNIQDARERELKQAENAFADRAVGHKKGSDLLLALEENYRIQKLGINKKYDDQEQAINDASIKGSADNVKNGSDELLKSIKANQKQRLTEEEKTDSESVAIEESKQQGINKIKQQGWQLAVSLGSALQAIESNIAQSKIQEVEEKSNKEKDILEDRYKHGLISKDNFDKQIAELDEKKRKEEAAIRKNQFETDRQIALIKIAISTAQGIANALEGDTYTVAYRVAFAALTGAAELAVVASQPTPKFAKGGKIGGRLHSEGGTLIEAEKNEWIINRKESEKNDKLLNAINAGNSQKYIYEMYVAPVLKEQLKKQQTNKDNSFAQNIANSMMLNNGSFKDINILDSLKMNRRADKENVDRLILALSKQQVNIRNIV